LVIRPSELMPRAYPESSPRQIFTGGLAGLLEISLPKHSHRRMLTSMFAVEHLRAINWIV